MVTKCTIQLETPALTGADIQGLESVLGKIKLGQKEFEWTLTLNGCDIKVSGRSPAEKSLSEAQVAGYVKDMMDLVIKHAVK